MIECTDSAGCNRKSAAYTGYVSSPSTLSFGMRCLVHQLYRGFAWGSADLRRRRAEIQHAVSQAYFSS